MLNTTLTLKKMQTEWQKPTAYYFIHGNEKFFLNTALESKINICFTGNIYCIQCNRKTNKSFQQGYCFPCLRRLQECNLCIIHPERCRVELGQCPPDDWAHQHCHQEHVVYLANSSGLKVGITRHSQIPTRWIDQGAKQAITLFRVNNRYQAGILEVALKKFVSDRTQWQMILKNDVIDINLTAERDRLLAVAEKNLLPILEQFTTAIRYEYTANIINISYPVLAYPNKINNLSFDKTPSVEGILLGIKGQYLLLDTGVINIRKFSGYEVKLVVSR